MIPTLLFVAFVVMMLMGVPIGAALGLAGAAFGAAVAGREGVWGSSRPLMTGFLKIQPSMGE